MDLRLDVSERDGWSVLQVGGEIDVATAPRLREHLIKLVNEQRDMLGVDSIQAIEAASGKRARLKEKVVVVNRCATVG